MKEDYNQAVNENDKNDCGCSDGNCKPKKKNITTKVISLIILLAAITIIVIKVTGHSGNTTGKQLVNGKTTCDTSKSSTCDTSKGSSCCSKK